MAMNAAEDLSTAISRALPDAAVTIDPPAHDSGQWWIDVTRGDRKATIEWRPKQGFGIGFGVGGYGEGPDLIVSTIDAAVSHVVEYVGTHRRNAPTDQYVEHAVGGRKG
jgi:hypothetical protein